MTAERKMTLSTEMQLFSSNFFALSFLTGAAAPRTMRSKPDRNFLQSQMFNAKR